MNNFEFKKIYIKKIYLFVLLALTFFVLSGCDLYTYVRFKYTYDTYHVNVGERLKVIPSVEKGKNADNIIMMFVADNPRIATYKNGEIFGLSEGETVIRVIHKLNPEVKAEAKLIVSDPIYKLEYSIGEGAVNNPKNPSTYKMSQLPLLLSSPTKEGYTFLGWYMYPTFTGEVVNRLNKGIVARDRTLYAKWGYTINYELDGGSNNRTNPKTYSSSNLPIELLEPTKEGFTFSGWYDNPDFLGEKVTTILENSSGNKTFYAKWE